MTTFDSLALPAELRPGLDALDLTTMTPIQSAALPDILAGADVIAQAPTGSGKTVAFSLGLLRGIDATQWRTQGLVLCPTRELATQVAGQVRKLATGIANLKVSLLCGGMSLEPQIASLQQHDPHIVVGTPGRVQELMRKKHLHLAGVRVLVLDEADRLLDMGFADVVKEIVGKTPPKRQTLLFSATYDDAVRELAAALQQDPKEHRVEGDSEPDILERFYEVELAAKPATLAALLQKETPESCVVFCNTRQDTRAVVDELGKRRFSCATLHGEMEQRDRDEVLLRFANRSLRVLVASDVAARGLDIAGLAMVVNYELPTDLASYLHRIGRTARAGESGVALSLVTPREMPRALALERERDKPLRWKSAPSPSTKTNDSMQAAMTCLRIDAGKTDKLRPGDILGALTGDAGLPASAVGKIDVFPTRSYVAITRDHAKQALDRLQTKGIKARKRRVTRL
ncbi:MAG: ATP-dependent RNA helicase DbpA [Rhodanobacteraceae bacterium]|nr:ATP-dependent RNA helicase DbpA [Xanthomonadales bacterium]MCP5477249.1 ATP-dependent RNA helicase DbpA [Rhodanobacteraceae bacterium]HPF73987.1 ATP-dependent RNA helicase DbpA [Xanthomonadaceae bacterium]HRY00363.1 ATP-dependent RNA helicase DbpA [Xanthomonadaceae bacterium]